MTPDSSPAISCTLDVRVQPRARRDSVEVDALGRIRIRLVAAPVDGKANEALVRLVAERLGVPRSSVDIVRGHRSRDKVLRIEGLSSQAALARLPD